MSKHSISIVLFFLFALGLPIWGMQANEWTTDGVSACSGECYAQWKAKTGGVIEIEAAKALAKAQASPAELGKQAYLGCIACHGAAGEGGIGPQLSGSKADMVVTALTQYRAGETLGAQSALMWSQAQALTDQDIENLAAFIETL